MSKANLDFYFAEIVSKGLNHIYSFYNLMAAKIIHIVEGFSEGGIHVFLKNLISYSSQFEHQIFYGLRNNSYDIKKNIAQYPAIVKFEHWKYAQRNISPTQDFLALINLIKFLQQNKSPTTIVHLHSSKAGFIGRIACWVLKIKSCIYTPHGGSFLIYKQGIKKFLYEKLEKIGNWFGGTIVCVSQSEQRAFELLNISTAYIYNGVEIMPKKNLHTNEQKFKIVNVARAVYQKHPELFNSIANHFIHNPHIEFIWIGDGDLKNVLTAPNIKTTGWLNPVEVKTQLEKANIYLSTSRYEGFSISILEAMSHSLPLVLTDCIGNEDMVIQNFNGVLFQNKNEAIETIENLFSNKSLRTKWGAESYNICNKSFNIENMITHYKNLYLSLLNKR